VEENLMNKFLLAATAAFLIPATAFAGTVYTRAWCKDKIHGSPTSDAGAYPWISSTFRGSTSDECWRYANDHKSRYGHQTGCSYVKSNGSIN
jgi:hypothetical protein